VSSGYDVIVLLDISKPRGGADDDLAGLLLACHQRIRRFIGLAHAAATRADVPAAEVADACVQVARYFTEALPLHVADEEDSILPRLRGRSPELDRALDAMADQHTEHEPGISALLEALGAVARDPGGADVKAALAEVARRLEAEFAEHLSLEESVIIPAVRELPADLQATIIGELRRRRRFDAP
jgi:hemerythrin-like domain-containing protein